ncbi:cyclic nucleotide-binding domain-containing protein [Stenotrophomonas tumulicola]|uniref:Cyclic nucleotide-binding domain-containing protein n=1 Tax=Stenotrophomonas tumulicola TaxID=1685415 RepID=A0A7W3IGY1_9GAMM|nr:cyclic nucleotide-binding domain-containing protein [Stenotrophomonas tumulicola]MBA8681410.1 cyclic nucleotide-binding domain-containing protein [Stenotrophomonas tumulicola]
MLARFTGDEGRRNLLYALSEQKLVRGDKALAEALASSVTLLEAQTGAAVIHQGGVDNDVYLILTGAFDVFVNGKRVAQRHAGEHVGEMAAMQPAQIRSASVIAAQPSVVARVSAARLDELAQQFPQIHRYVAQELARRLYQRNDHIGSARERTRVLLLASTLATAAALVVQDMLGSEGFVVRHWQEGLVRSGGQSVQHLQEMAAGVDFAIVLGDATAAQGPWPATRDELLLETGVLLGVLGSNRTVFLEARSGATSVTDLAGVVNLHWVPADDRGLDVALTPVCTRLRRYFEAQGPYEAV